MAVGAWPHRLTTLFLLALLLGIGIGVRVGVSAPNDPAMVFGSDAGVVLTFVSPDKTDDFDRVLDRFRTVLEESGDPIRRQQSGNWRIFLSPDPGPAGSVLYVSFMEPVLKGANYDMADIMAEELPEDEAEELLALLVPHPVPWTHICAMPPGVAHTPRAPRSAFDTQASRDARSGCTAPRSRPRRRGRPRGSERFGRGSLAP